MKFLFQMRIIFILLFAIIASQPLHSQVVINEVVTSNVNGILDEDGEFSDWIEIYNNSDSLVNVIGFGLSDDLAFPSRWTFPELKLTPKQQFLIFASGKNKTDKPLTYNTFIDTGEEWRYIVPSSDMGTAWHDTGYVDSTWLVGKSSFGYADLDDTTVIAETAVSVFIRKDFTVTNVSNIVRLILNIDYDDGFVAYINGKEAARSNLGTAGEYMAYDRLAFASHEALMIGGSSPEYYDIDPSAFLHEGTNIIAIQVHNNSATSSDLSLIPFLTAGYDTGSISYISPFLKFPRLHTNFRLDADSEHVYLYDRLGNLIDSAGNKIKFADVSFGRKPDGSSNWYFFGSPTPGTANSTCASSPVIPDTVVFSPGGGKCIKGTKVTLSALHSTGDTIYYTIDGSIPDTADPIYTGPLTINGSQVIRARIIKNSSLPGPVSTQTYVTGINHDLPVVCLSTEPANLWDTMTGIYAFGPTTPTDLPYYSANFWKDWERPVFVELYDVNGIPGIQQNAGMKIFGGWSRASDQKSLSLFARKAYGKGSFNYRLFADKPIEKFESFILRNSGNDNMGLQFHDCFMTGLMRETEIDRQAYQPAAIYINGQYWGVLNMREKVTEHYIAENHHVNADSVNLLEYDGGIINGSNKEYLELRNFMGIKTLLQSSADYAWVLDRIDLDNFIQYQLANIYLDNRDWPGNNIKFWNTTAAGSKWRWIMFDTDFGYGIWNTYDYQFNTLDFALEQNGPSWPNPAWSTLFLRRLVTNTEFRNNFIIQFCDRLNQDFSPSQITADLDSLKDLYDHEMPYHFNRWWNSYDNWLWLISQRKTFGNNRPSFCRQYLQSEFSLSQQLNVTVNVFPAGQGDVKLNTIFPKSFPFSGIYFKNIPITLKAVPKPGYTFVRWEGAINSTQASITYDMATAGTFKAVFTEAGSEDYSIVINEINFNSSPRRDTKDWIEIANNGTATADISGWLLIDSGEDSGFVFQPGTLMPPGSYMVICRDQKDFISFNPNVKNIVGDFPFGLSAEGDCIRLFDADSRLVDQVNYGIVSPWPDGANGTGVTLELNNPEFDNTLPGNWITLRNGGTPGVVNSNFVTSTDPDPAEKSFDLNCYPNPFRDFTTIKFTVVSHGTYRLEVFDLQGRLIKILADQHLEPGSYWVDWTGEGSGPSGSVFTIRLTGNEITELIKIVKL